MMSVRVGEEEEEEEVKKDISEGERRKRAGPAGWVLEEQALREYVLALFWLPRAERLHEVASCSVWTPHARAHTAGTLYTTDSYLGFSSRDEDHCLLLMPLSTTITHL
ncbi:hypothetical protein CRUP_021966 [Coryphaenoides rupestris]|nr:hypothetical protein CRUP_021966 [Coryphaenoides rupestris]